MGVMIMLLMGKSFFAVSCWLVFRGLVGVRNRLIALKTKVNDMWNAL